MDNDTLWTFFYPLSNNIRNENNIKPFIRFFISNYFYWRKKWYINKDYNIKYQLKSSDNQNNKKYYNVSTIKLGECEKELKEYYKMGDNAPLPIFKVDYYNELLQLQ